MAAGVVYWGARSLPAARLVQLKLLWAEAGRLRKKLSKAGGQAMAEQEVSPLLVTESSLAAKG
jgi:hypothetical protein